MTRTIAKSGSVEILGSGASITIKVTANHAIYHDLVLGLPDSENLIDKLQEHLGRMKERAVRRRPRRLATHKHFSLPEHHPLRRGCKVEYTATQARIPIRVDDCRRRGRQGGRPVKCCPPDCDFLCHDHYRGINDKVWHCWAKKSTREKRTL